MTVPDLTGAMERWREGAIRAYPARSIHASMLGFPCARRLVYDQTQPAAKHDTRRERMFARGRAAETQAFLDYCEAVRGGEIELIRQQDAIPQNAYGIGGVIDWWVRWHDADGPHVAPCEFKSCTRHVFDSITTVADMVNHRWPHCRRWPAQLMTYMLLKNMEHGVFLLRCVEDFRDKQINVALDYEYAEGLLKRAESIRDAVALVGVCRQNGTPEEQAMPPRIKYGVDTCGECPHVAVCIPDVSQAPGVVNRLWDAELNALCHIALNPVPDKLSDAEWEAAQEQVKAATEKVKLHGKETVKGLPPGEQRITLTDDFQVTAKVYARSYTDLPAAVKAQYAKKRSKVRVDIRRADAQDAA